jgi:hypothetical protein
VEGYSTQVFGGLAMAGEIKGSLAAERRRGEYKGRDELDGADAAAMTAEAWPE